MTNWTPEQLHIFSRVSDTTANLMIEALAGSGKTTTLVGIADRLGSGTLALAFNKRAAEEMKSRLPATAEARTLNSLGHRIWGQKLGKRLRVSMGKMSSIVRRLIDEADSRDREELWENYAAILATCRYAKAHGHVPTEWATSNVASLHTLPLLSDEELLLDCPEELTSTSATLVLDALAISWVEALNGSIDFDDQLLLPTMMKCLYPFFPNILVDEAQDLSSLNHVMLRRLAKRRFIGVGDSLQAIYAFRGAHESSMGELRSTFDAEVCHLSTSFRCPEAICQSVRWHASRINAWSSNPNNPGNITYLDKWHPSIIPSGGAVLCRNNAPLLRIAIELIKTGRRPNVWGRDITSGLMKIMESLGGPRMTRDNALAALESYAQRKADSLTKRSAKLMLADRVSCVHVFLSETDTLGGAIAMAKDVLESDGVIDLATGHKAKGHEWQSVFILDRHLLGEGSQENNLAYVMATRSMRDLTYVATEGIAAD